MSVVPVLRRSGRTELHEVPRPATPSRLWLAALGAVTGLGVIYHWLQSLGHTTPAVFTDELLFAELARSFASGEAFLVRGEALFFPAFVPALLQAPAWLAGSTPLAYELAKAMNTLLMCSAALPAYWLARMLLRPAYALVVAGATLASGAMLYHGYLTSEAAAYPVFLLAFAVCLRAIVTPSAGRHLLALAVLGLAVATRAQFVVLPLVFGLAIVLAGRPLRRHATGLAGLGAVGLLALGAGGSALGFYGGAKTLDYPLLETLRWSWWTAALLPFAAGMVVVPGALVALWLGLRRPRDIRYRAFSTMTALLLVLLPLEAGLIAGGEQRKPFERYAFYLVPLLFVAFFTLAGRSVGRVAYGGAAVGLAGLALAVPFASLALGPFSYDSTTISAVESLGRWLGQGDAAALVGAAGVVAALAAFAIRSRPVVAGAVSAALMLALGASAYSGDRRMTERTLASLAPAQPDWLERTGVESADVLVLPGSSLHAGWVLESWNRNVGRTYHLGDLPTDPLPNRSVGVGADGTVTTAGAVGIESRHLVVNDAGSRVELNGRLLERPGGPLGLYELDGPLRIRSLADGLYPDGWARSVVTYSVWPAQARAGVYRLSLSLPEGREARAVEVEAGPVRQVKTLRPGSTASFRIPASGRPIPPLAIRVERADFVDAGTPQPRLVGARVESLEFAAKKGSRN